MPDKIIECVECHDTFVHSEGAQKFYVQKGFSVEPKRCPPCRKERNARKGRPRQ